MPEETWNYRNVITHMNQGGPAYPGLFYGDKLFGKPEYIPGMSLLDYFAGQALAATANQYQGVDDWQRKAAVAAYKCAKEMIIAREDALHPVS